MVNIIRIKRLGIISIGILAMASTLGGLPLAYGESSVTTNSQVGLSEVGLSEFKSEENTAQLLEKQKNELEAIKIEKDLAIKREKERIAEEKRKAEEEAKRQLEEQKRAEEEARKLEESKVVISSEQEAHSFNIKSKSNWTEDDFKRVLPESMYKLIPVALDIEEELGINAVFLISISANEVGWGEQFKECNNYFNWSSNGKDYYSFENIDELQEFSIRNFEKFTHNDFYARDDKSIPDVITPDVVNTKYALNDDESPNTLWSETVCKIMHELSDSRLEMQ